MDLAAAYYLGITLLLFIVFAAIVAHVMNPRRKESGEEAKYRMMDED